MAVTSLLLTKISVVIPKILLCDDSSMAAVLNAWMTVIRKLTKLPGFYSFRLLDVLILMLEK
jgi:hypothetical protein